MSNLHSKDFNKTMDSLSNMLEEVLAPKKKPAQASSQSFDIFALLSGAGSAPSGHGLSVEEKAKFEAEIAEREELLIKFQQAAKKYKSGLSEAKVKLEKLPQLEEENSSLRKTVQLDQETIAELKRVLDAAKEREEAGAKELKILVERTSRQSTDLSQKDSTINSLKQEAEGATKLRLELSGKKQLIEERDASLASQQRLITEKDKEIAAGQKREQEAKSTYDNGLASISNQYKKKVDELSNRLQSEASRYGELSSAFSSLEAEKQALHKENQALRQSGTTPAESVDTAVLAAIRQENAQLKEANRLLSSELHSTKAVLELANNQQSTGSAIGAEQDNVRISELNAEIAALKEKLQSSEQSKLAIQSDAEKRIGIAKGSKGEREQILEEALAKEEAAKKELEEKILRNSEILAAQEITIDSLRESNRTNQQRISQVTEENSAAIQQLKSANSVQSVEILELKEKNAISSARVAQIEEIESKVQQVISIISEQNQLLSATFNIFARVFPGVTAEELRAGVEQYMTTQQEAISSPVVNRSEIREGLNARFGLDELSPLSGFGSPSPMKPGQKLNLQSLKAELDFSDDESPTKPVLGKFTAAEAGRSLRSNSLDSI